MIDLGIVAAKVLGEKKQVHLYYKCGCMSTMMALSGEMINVSCVEHQREVKMNVRWATWRRFGK